MLMPKYIDSLHDSFVNHYLYAAKNDVGHVIIKEKWL